MPTQPGIRIEDMPNLGAVTDDSFVVGDRAGSGLFTAPALRSYTTAGLPGTLPEAPSDGTAYGRMNAAWVHVPQSSELASLTTTVNNLVASVNDLTARIARIESRYIAID